MAFPAVLLNQAVWPSKLAHRRNFAWATPLKNQNFKNVNFYVKKLFFANTFGIRAVLISAANSPYVASKVVVDRPLPESECTNSAICTILLFTIVQLKNFLKYENVCRRTHIPPVGVEMSGQSKVWHNLPRRNFEEYMLGHQFNVESASRLIK